MKILSFTPSEHIFPDTVKGQNAVVETRLRITGGSTLLSPGVIDPRVPYGFVLKSVTGGPHVTSGHVWLNGKWFVHTDKSINQIKDSAFYYLGTASGGTLAAEFKPVALSITSPGSEISPGDVLNILFDYSAVWDIDVLYSINGGTPISHATGVSATGSYMFDTAGITFSHGDILTVILKDTDSSLNDTVSFDLMVATITIDSINNGLPLTYEGLFEDGMWYFADTTGTKVVDQNDPDRSEWFVGTGNADGDIDLDIKMLAITDVVVPETVQLGVAFDVSGNYVMLEDKIVIEAFDGVTWKKIHAGDYIEVADGSFTESVTIESADGFTVNNAVTVRVRSYDGYALNGSDSTDVIATVTMNAISGVVDGTPYTLEGTTDGDTVEIWVDDGTGYAYEGDAVVVGSAWSYDITLAVGTYGVKAIDGTDSRGFTEQTGVVVASASIVETLSMGYNFGIAVWGGKAYGWGSGNAGVLGNGVTTAQPRPYPVAVDVASSLYGKTVKKVSCGSAHTLFLCTDGTVHACGDTVNSGAVGDGGTTNRLKPVAVAVDAESSLNGKTVVDISAGYYHSIALDSDGGVHAWGANYYGEIGDNTTTIRRKPVAVSTATSLNGKTVTKVFGGTYRSFCVCSDGTAHGWGYNDKGQIGDNSTTNRPRPVAVSMATSLNGKKVIYVAPQGRVSTIFLADDGTVHGCGENSSSEIGDNTTTQRNQPVATNAGAASSLYGKTAKHITACWNSYTSHCVCSDGSIHAWGYNEDTGQLGDNSANYTVRAIPVAVSTATSLAGKTVVQCSDGLGTGACLCSDGSAHGWGYNTGYQIGDNTNIQRRQPVAVDKTLVV